MTKLMKLVAIAQIVFFTACSFSDTENYIKRGDELILLEKYNEAISAYTKAIKLDSLNSKAFYKRALVLYEIEKYDYKNKDADWKNSKDAIQRGMQKLRGSDPSLPPHVLKK